MWGLGKPKSNKMPVGSLAMTSKAPKARGPATASVQGVPMLQISDADAFEILMVDMLIGSKLFSPETVFAPQMKGWYTAIRDIAKVKYNWDIQITVKDL